MAGRRTGHCGKRYVSGICRVADFRALTNFQGGSKMSVKLFVCALITAVTVALPLLAILVIHRKGMCKLINKLGVMWVVSILALYTQQFIF